MPLSLSICSQSGPPICTSFWAFFRAFKASRAPEGPQIKFSHILMHRPYRDLHNLKFSCLYLIPFAHKVVPQKASGRGGGGSYTTLQLVNILVAKRKACLQPEKTQGYQYLFAVQFFNSYVYRGRLVAGLDKVFENRDRHHRIRRQILRQNEGLIWFLAQS